MRKCSVIWKLELNISQCETTWKNMRTMVIFHLLFEYMVTWYGFLCGYGRFKDIEQSYHFTFKEIFTVQNEIIKFNFILNPKRVLNSDGFGKHIQKWFRSIKKSIDYQMDKQSLVLRCEFFYSNCHRI